MERSLREETDVNRLLDKSRFWRYFREESSAGMSSSLLFVSFNLLRELRSAIELGKLFSLLKERSSSSNLLRDPISGGKYLYF